MDSKNISHSHRLFFERLGSLTQLQFLHIMRGKSRGVQDRVIDNNQYNFLNFRLKNGLESPRRLRQLEELDLSGTLQQLDESDVNWMVENWP
jgi:hypothetical protein